MLVKIYLLDIHNILLDVLLNSGYISPLEKLSFEKYKNEQVKIEKIASAYLKNKYIGEYHLNKFGKPISDIKTFNISHSHGLVVLVIDTLPIGVDIEKIRPVEKDLINYISSDKEKDYIKNEENFFEVWTNKEALTKAYGSGINEKVRDIPALPINNVRTYKEKVYYNKTIKYQDYIITVSRESDEDFSLEIIQEVI